MDQKRTIYAHMFPDKSVYVGSTSQEKLYKRWQYGVGYDKQPKVYEKICMYGWKNIEHIILECGNMSSEEVLKKECDYTMDYFNKGYEVLNKYNTENPCRYRGKEKYIYYTENGEEFETGTAMADYFGVTKQSVYISIKNGGRVKGVKVFKRIKEDN